MSETLPPTAADIEAVIAGAAAPPPPAAPAAPATPAPAMQIPWLGLTAVLLGTFVSTVNSRLSNFGLADIRGAVHASFDQGAWITTAQSVAQMLMAPAAIWLGGVYGPRKVLMEAAIAFAAVCMIQPFAPNIQTMLGLQFVGGLASGCFIPLTLGFILRNMPPKVWAYGIALYALNLEVSLNVSASLEGWYIEHLSWRWIFWQNVPLAIGMWYCLRFGTKPEPVNTAVPPPDWFGLLAGGIGLGLIYAALDQGNRLDWQNSGLVWGLMCSGAVLLVAFFINERLSKNPGLNLKVAFTAPLPRLLVLVGFLRLTILSTAFLIPQFLTTVRGYRALEVGQTLIWLAVPQLLICLIAGYSMRRMDPRFIASCGFILICVGCLMVAHGLTPSWGTDQFLPSQLVQAVGQSFALSGTVFFAVLHLRPQDALTFGAALQTARIMGGEVGLAFITTFLRVRGQVASNLLGQHVQIGDAQVLQRIQAYGAATARAGDPASQATRGAAILNNIVHATSITQGIMDSFVVLSGATAITVMLVVTRRAAPQGPASPAPFFTRRAARAPMKVFAAIFLLMLVGCTVGPNFHAPEPPAGAQAPLLNTAAAHARTAEPPQQWWQLYQDPTLNDLVQEAFRANTDLAVAAANLSAARATLESARNGRYPQTQVEVATERARDATTDEILEFAGHPPETFWFYDAMIDVSYEVDLFGHVRRAIEAARADTEAALAARDVVQITVAAETTRAYAQVCSLGEAIAVARHSIDVVTHEQQITVDRRDAGAAADFDVVRAQALLAQVRAALPPLIGQRQSALYQLAQLLGRAPGGAPQAAQDCEQPPTLAALIPVGDGGSLLARRPDVRQAERRVAGASARIGVATADLYPRITLLGDYGGIATQVSQVPQSAGLTWGIGPKISWAFPNQAGVRARIQQARAAEQAAVASFDGVVLGALRETDQALSTYAAELDRRQDLGVSRDRARQAFAMANDQFLAGATSNLDLLSAEITAVNADAALAASDGAIAQAQIAVFKALGGGWQK